MAGRGCSIKVQVTRMNGEDTIVEELSLPVALHSPLHVLRDHLQELTGITPASQVLILCDLSDPDRNRDVLLTGRDYESLFECGIRENSFLTLHPIGIVRQTTQSQETKTEIDDGPDVYVVSTTITPAQANHSYNGVIFDIESRGIYETEIISLSFGGMLGRVRIYVRDRNWEPIIDDSYGSWRSIGLATDGWECMADVMCPPSWDRATEIRLRNPVTILPHSRRAFYIHSSLPDDLGIQYQSFLEDDIIFQDERIAVYPGLGHTGSEPFDDIHGWYRAFRGLAGGIKYRSKAKHWTIHDHALFPSELREAVVTTLLCRQRSENHYFSLAMVRTPQLIRAHTYPLSTASSNYNPEMGTITRRHDFNLLDYETEEKQFVEEATQQFDQFTGVSPEDMPSRLISLPLHVVYYILEFMDWDWFAEVRRRRRDRSSFSDDAGGDQLRHERTRRRRSYSGSTRSRDRYIGEEETHSRSGFNPLQALGGILSGTSRRLMSIQDVIELLLGGGNADEITLMFGDDNEDEKDDDDDEDDDDYEDSKEDIDSSTVMENSEPDPYSMDEDGYEHKSGDIPTDSNNTNDESDDDDLTSDIRLRGLGGNSSDGPNI